MDWLYFLGRLHVVFLHLPIGFLILTIVLELLSRTKRFAVIDSAMPLLWLLTAVGAVLTATLGLMHAQEGIEGSSVAAHRAYGISLAAATTAAWILRRWAVSVFSFLRLPLMAALLVVVTLTGHYGGNITHGSAYLVEYAPETVRNFAGATARKRAAVRDLAQADVYLDLVEPTFRARCASCHNEDRRKGGLSLSRLDRLLAGGTDGPVIVRGDAKSSELYRRVTLPSTDEHAMPAEGRESLSDSEKRVIEWWITAGAPSERTVGQIGEIGADVRSAMLDVVGLGAKSATDASAHASQPGDAHESDKLEELGLMARVIAAGDSRLTVSLVSGGRMSPPVLAGLISSKERIIELKLARVGLTDSDLRSLSQLTSLERLQVQENPITDVGAQTLVALSAIRSLNLYGTKVTDRAFEKLVALPSLRDLYVSGTQISPAAIARAKIEHPDVRVYGDISLERENVLSKN